MKLFLKITIIFISKFYGIRIMIYFDNNIPEHFHVEYGENEAVFSI